MASLSLRSCLRAFQASLFKVMLITKLGRKLLKLTAKPSDLIPEGKAALAVTRVARDRLGSRLSKITQRRDPITRNEEL